MRTLSFTCVLACVLVVWSGCSPKQPTGPADAVVMQTSQGDLVIELFPELAPQTVDIFRNLVTAKAYDGLAFESYERSVLLTTEVPTSELAQGLHSLVPAEVNGRKNVYGTVGLVPGEAQNGALYISLTRNEAFDSDRIVIGQLIQGAEALDKLHKGDTIQKLVPTQKREYNKVAVMATNKGDLVIEFYPESALHTVDNFKKLAASRFYDGLTFHRYVQGFVVQGGDPNGDGTGGPGWTIPDEYRNAYQRPHELGTIAMARTQAPNSAGSQFYFCLDRLANLDGNYTTFGQIIQGIDVMKQLRQGDQIIHVTLKDRAKYATVK